MAKLSTQEFIDALKELTVLELNDLVKACEEEFGVSAAAGVVVAAAGPAAAAEEDLVDSAPKMIKEQVSKEEAEEIQKKVEAEGAKVTLK